MIEFSDIEIKYGDFIAIKNLNLSIKEGEFFTFLGPSGCGKTTILRTLVGFIEPSGGTISIMGEDVTHIAVEKRGIGMVFQSYALFPTMTVYENIAFGLKVKKYSSDQIREKVHAVAKTIEINEQQLHRNVAELSGGQQQRVALARALVLEPKILCLDEPLSNLDAKLRVGLRGELKRLQRTLGITTLYVTHDQEEALTLSDRIAVFNNGFLEQVGTPFEIYNASKSEFVCDFIGDINRLASTLLAKINEDAETSFSLDKPGFIRIERVAITEQERTGWVNFQGTVLDYEYNGVLTKYTLLIDGEQLKCIEKNDGSAFHAEGETVYVALNPRDIMQF